MNNNLLNSSDFAEIRDVLNDTMFTFFKEKAIYRIDKNTATRWMSDIEDERTYDDIELNCLIVWEGSDKDAKIDVRTTGAHDFSKGYILLRFDDCINNGIVDSSKNVDANPAQDKLVLKGISYKVEGIVLVGQLEDTDVMIKVLFSKDLKFSK